MLNSSIWRAVLSLFYPPVIIRGKNGKNSENPVGSNKSEKRKPKSAVYRSFWASVVYFHLRLISTKSHKREMTRNQFGSNPTRVRIPPAAPTEAGEFSPASVFYALLFSPPILFEIPPSPFLHAVSLLYPHQAPVFQLICQFIQFFSKKFRFFFHSWVGSPAVPLDALPNFLYNNSI